MMKEETVALLDAAAEAIRPHWPYVEIAELPDERDVSLPHLEYRVVWPGYGMKKEPGALLLFRCGVPARPEVVDHLLDPKKLALATDECRLIAKTRNRIAQGIRQSERPELNALTAEADALVAAGFVPADSSQQEVYPLYPVVYRILSLQTPTLDTSPDALMQVFHAIVLGELPFTLKTENRYFVRLYTVTVMESDSASLQMTAELRSSGEAAVYWSAVVNGASLPIAMQSFAGNAERVAPVCPTPRQALSLARRLDAIRRLLENVAD